MRDLTGRKVVPEIRQSEATECGLACLAMVLGYHGHDATNDPNQTATLESYDTLMAYGKYNGVNLDIGHFTAANYDAVAFIKEHHAKNMAFSAKACTVAAQMKKMKEQAAQGGGSGPQAQPLPAGPL